MTQTFAVNAQNDIYLDNNGNLAIVYDLTATLQACAQAAKTILSEMILNVTQGIPYFQTVWVGVPNQQQFNAALRGAFFGVAGVVEIVSLITAQLNDTLTYTAIIRTIYGTGGLTG